VALGHYMRKLAKSKGTSLAGSTQWQRKARWRRAIKRSEVLRAKPQYETDNASIRNDEGSASLVKSVRRCFNLALDTPWESWGYDSQRQVEPRAVPLQWGGKWQK